MRNLISYTGICLLGFSLLNSLNAQDSSQIAPNNYLNLGINVNSEYVELNPQINGNDTRLYFVREDHQKNNDFQEIWCSEKDSSGNWGKAYKLPPPLNKGLANSVARVFPDRDELLIKGFYKKGKYKGRGYSLTKFTDGKWSVPLGISIEDFDKLDKGIFNNACMSPDEKVLIFSLCESPGGTENNLYVSVKNTNGTFPKPQKLPAPLNIDGHFDFAPFISDDGKSLYFSSDRPGGLGANDIYKSTRLDESWLNWSEPVNLGNRINTSGRDSYFSIDSSESIAYMISDIKSLGKTDVVMIILSPVKAKLTILVKDSSTLQPLTGNIRFLFPDSLGSLQAANGMAYRNLFHAGKIIFQADAEGYSSNKDSITINTNDYKKTISKTILLSTLIKKKKVKIVFNADQGLKAKIKVPGLNPQEEFDTDREGKAELNLAPNKRYNIIVSKNGHQTIDTSIFVSDDKDSTLVLKFNLTPKKYTFPNLYFDTDKSNPNQLPDSVITNLFEMMTLNPNLILYIAGHTDDVGSEPYNLELSKRRAKSINDKLILKGIHPNRIKSTGYGETRPQVKGITAEARSRNRRIEFSFESLPRYR
jgi:OOP family OmpA-OmpF porin